MTDMDALVLKHSFGGKLHIGFVDIRNKLDSILKEREARRVKRRGEEEKVCMLMYVPDVCGVAREEIARTPEGFCLV